MTGMGRVNYDAYIVVNRFCMQRSLDINIDLCENCYAGYVELNGQPFVNLSVFDRLWPNDELKAKMKQHISETDEEK